MWLWLCVWVCFAFLLNRKLIPEDSLSCENVLYWRALCEFFKAKGDDGEEMLERVLPDAATYAEYLDGWDIGGLISPSSVVIYLYLF